MVGVGADKLDALARDIIASREMPERAKRLATAEALKQAVDGAP